MIAFVEGQLVEKQPTHIIVNVGGIGMEMEIPLSSFQALGRLNGTVHVFTHLNVREDSWNLFGFATTDEKNLFRQLVSVSGIGPKLAITILSGISVADFASAILMEDVKALSSIQGVGKKTAARLVMELREAVNKAGVGTETELPIAPAGGDQNVTNDAVMGLVALGYERVDARRAVAQVTASSDEAFTSESLLRRVLQQRGQ